MLLLDFLKLEPMDCWEIYMFLKLYAKFPMYIPIGIFLAANHSVFLASMCPLSVISTRHFFLRFNPWSMENYKADSIPAPTEVCLSEPVI